MIERDFAALDPISDNEVISAIKAIPTHYEGEEAPAAAESTPAPATPVTSPAPTPSAPAANPVASAAPGAPPVPQSLRDHFRPHLGDSVQQFQSDEALAQHMVLA